MVTKETEKNNNIYMHNKNEDKSKEVVFLASRK